MSKHLCFEMNKTRSLFYEKKKTKQNKKQNKQIHFE